MQNPNGTWRRHAPAPTPIVRGMAPKRRKHGGVHVDDKKPHGRPDLPWKICRFSGFVDIFNILCATASRYVDSEGTFVRKLTMSDYPLLMRESLGGYDPIIVFVDSEIEEAIRASVGDLSSIMRRYPLHPGVDWITFQYHMSLLQQEVQTGWNAPGFRRGGRLPMSVGNICQNLIAHDAFVSCHSTPLKDWRRVRHMNTLGKDPATRGNYVHDAIAALLEYNQLAAQADPQLEEMVMDDLMMIDHDDWTAHVDTLIRCDTHWNRHHCNP